MRRAFIPAIFLTTLIFSGCDTDPLEVPCPDLAAGDLVVTEIRGPQTGADMYGEWIEVFNATNRTLDLAGLSVAITKLDGSSSLSFLVRTPTSVSPGGYVVFGRQDAGAEPSHVDYGYRTDVDSKLFDSGAVELTTCGTAVDLAVYRNLPNTGTLVLNGATAPDAENNSDEANWCIDSRDDANASVDGSRGSPQFANPFCDGSSCDNDNSCASGSCDLVANPSVCIPATN